jgi:hypothetical protein
MSKKKKRDKVPPVRTDYSTYIELDRTKNERPFFHLGAILADGEPYWVMLLDARDDDQIVGESQHLALMVFKPKRIRALREFLNSVDLGDEPDAFYEEKDRE